MPKSYIIKISMRKEAIYMDQELRSFLSALKTGQENLAAQIERLGKKLNAQGVRLEEEIRSGNKVLKEKLSAKIEHESKGLGERLNTKIDRLSERLSFV